MKEIHMNNSPLPALIDDEDWERVSPFTWYFNGHIGYVMAGVWKHNVQSQLLLHRVVMDAAKGVRIDHIDHNTFNNQKANLRVATASQNAANSYARTCATKTSRFKGVCLDRRRNKWMARISRLGKHMHVGYFSTEIEAASAYNAAAVKHFGEFACLNQL